MDSFHELNIKHIYREKNHVVNTLSKEALDTEEDILQWEEILEGNMVDHGLIFFFDFDDVPP